MALSFISDMYQTASPIARGITIVYNLFIMNYLENNSAEFAIRGTVVTLYAAAPEFADYAAGVAQIGLSLRDLATEVGEGDALQASIAAVSAIYNYYLLK